MDEGSTGCGRRTKRRVGILALGALFGAFQPAMSFAHQNTPHFAHEVGIGIPPTTAVVVCSIKQLRINIFDGKQGACFLLRVQHVCCAGTGIMPYLRSTYPQAMNKKPPTNAADIFSAHVPYSVSSFGGGKRERVEAAAFTLYHTAVRPPSTHTERGRQTPAVL